MLLSKISVSQCLAQNQIQNSPPITILQAYSNGYCFDFPNTNVLTYTITPTSNLIQIVWGYSILNTSVQLVSQKLFDSNCNYIGDGSVFNVTSDSSYYFEIEFNVFTFDFFCIYYTSVDILNVTMYDYSAKVKNNLIEIQWITLSEVNNLKFNVYYSENLTTFVKVNEVYGQLNSNYQSTYSVTDKIRFQNYYYVIESEDLNGDKKQYITYVNVNINENYKYVNLLGQLVDENYNGYKIKVKL